MVTFATPTSIQDSMSGERNTAPYYIPEELKEIQFKLSHTLQRTLDVQVTLESFFRIIQDAVKVGAIKFDVNNLQVNIGRPQKHTAQYRIAFNDSNLDTSNPSTAHLSTAHLSTAHLGTTHLGTLTLSRSKRFMEAELAALELLIGVLFFPLRNALLYREALENSMRDSLTGIGNRLAMDIAFEREIKLARRYKQALSLVIIDIDFFKQTNDTHGHRCGDTVLKHVTDLVRAALRETDQVFRFGGEEFAVLLSNTDAACAATIAERIRINITKAPTLFNGMTIPATLSMGVSSLRERDAPGALFERADKALYRAKTNGRNKVEVEALCRDRRKPSL